MSDRAATDVANRCLSACASAVSARRPTGRRARFVLAATLASTAALAAAPSYSASAAYRVLDCRRLPGTGSFSDPVRIGILRRSTLVRSCRGLKSGRPFNVRYFSFTLTRRAPPGSAVGALFTLRANAKSAVHPRLATTDGWTLARSTTDGFWTGQSPKLGRFIRISPIPSTGQTLGAGTWIVGYEKLDSPLRSLRTPPFNPVLYLG